MFWALTTMTFSPGRRGEQRRQAVEAVAVGEDDVADDDVADAVVDQSGEAGGGLGRPHEIAGARQRPADDGADRRVVVGDDDRRLDHGGHAVGNRTRKIVRGGSLARSCSTMPP